MIKVFVNGTFDILHLGHTSLLNYAKTLGDELSVGIDSNSRVRKLKGTTRPINDERERAEMLINLKAVDKVYIFDTDEELVKLVGEHDIMVKGSDYKDKTVIGKEVCKELVFYNVLNGYSTTNKIQDIISRG
jgi:D-beta-D-heptose 7-phosphate kinase/D-beta-D-heptose 1-phosphate adenosyltransferase